MKAAFAEKPAFYALDVDGFAVKNSYNTQDLAAALREFTRLREDNQRLLRALPASMWSRSGIHPKRGEITIERIVEIMIGHDQSHLDQIAKAVAAV